MVVVREKPRSKIVQVDYFVGVSFVFTLNNNFKLYPPFYYGRSKDQNTNYHILNWLELSSNLTNKYSSIKYRRHCREIPRPKSFEHRRFYSSATNPDLNNKYSLNPSFITGLIDGEGSFIVSILKNPRYNTG